MRLREVERHVIEFGRRSYQLVEMQDVSNTDIQQIMSITGSLLLDLTDLQETLAS
jgi:hypothetical protein